MIDRGAPRDMDLVDPRNHVFIYLRNYTYVYYVGVLPPQELVHPEKCLDMLDSRCIQSDCQGGSSLLAAVIVTACLLL